MPSEKAPTVRELLLTRRGLAFFDSRGERFADDGLVRALELELAELGYVLSARLRARLLLASVDELVGFRAWARAALLAHIGGDDKHAREPLFRRFPHGIPRDTRALWWQKVLSHFLQGPEQPCLFCRRVGTTHVLAPCEHVVCDHCFDGVNYSACPVCEHRVDRSSPFFQSSPERGQASEKNIRFQLMDLGEDVAAEARALFASLCARTQPLAPSDRDALLSILAEYGAKVLPWLPSAIPVRENVAVIFGTLFGACDAAEVLPHAKRFMSTATDVLRFIAVLSGTDGSLLPETVFKKIDHYAEPEPWWGRLAELVGVRARAAQLRAISVPVQVSRFRVARLPRALRRALLAVLDALDPDRLVEDMLRHRSYWVWVGEFLHPHEYAARYPNAARGFQVVRKRAPDGTRAPAFQGWHARLEAALASRDTDAAVALLAQRPGEFARRLDHVLRTAADDAARERVIAAFADKVSEMATPVLLTLHAHLPARTRPAPVRVYWPRNRVGKGVPAADERPLLAASAVERAVRVIADELLRRFAERPGFSDAVVDTALRAVPVPFNQRASSRSAVSLPRGARVPVPAGKFMRLFLHWCEPAQDGAPTDLDLSVALYDQDWSYRAVCSYYRLRATDEDGTLLAQSSGDLRSAPAPEGASEFVDLHLKSARAAGIRYAVVVINAYDGMPFSRLERALAGVMLREDAGGAHFDPRTVELAFALDGEQGVFLPLVVDLEQRVLHWLDVHAKGQFAMNNAETSQAAISELCPNLMSYFASGQRPSMYDLALLHAAARCRRVFVREHGEAGTAEFVRAPDESIAGFHARLVAGDSDEPRARPPRGDGDALLAVLYRGDIALPADSSVYALFREQTTPDLAAGDLLA